MSGASLRTQLVNFLSEICPALLGVPKQTVQSYLLSGSSRQSQAEIEDVLASFVNDSNIRLLLGNLSPGAASVMHQP